MEINGKPVVDATRKAKIHITPRDVAEGDNKNPSACAAARAAKREIPNCLNARVHIGRVYIETPTKWVRYFTPDSLRTEIVAFDRGGSFQPGEYELKTPSAAESMEGRAKAAKKRSGSNTSRNKPGNIPTKNPRKLIAKIKHHEVSGIRPKGANR